MPYILHLSNFLYDSTKKRLSELKRMLESLSTYINEHNYDIDYLVCTGNFINQMQLINSFSMDFSAKYNLPFLRDADSKPYDAAQSANYESAFLSTIQQQADPAIADAFNSVLVDSMKAAYEEISALILEFLNDIDIDSQRLIICCGKHDKAWLQNSTETYKRGLCSFLDASNGRIETEGQNHIPKEDERCYQPYDSFCQMLKLSYNHRTILYSIEKHIEFIILNTNYGKNNRGNFCVNCVSLNDTYFNTAEHKHITVLVTHDSKNNLCESFISSGEDEEENCSILDYLLTNVSLWFCKSEDEHNCTESNHEGLTEIMASGFNSLGKEYLWSCLCTLINYSIHRNDFTMIHIGYIDKWAELGQNIGKLRSSISNKLVNKYAEDHEYKAIPTSILHISDLHFTRNPSMQNMRDTVLNEVRAHVKAKPLGKKLLVITGDFHNYWTTDYSDSINFINELIEAMGIEREKDVFLIPGNHDVANDKLMETIFKDTVPEWKRQNDESIEEIAKGHYNYIDVRMRAYVSYCQFAREIGAYPPLADAIADTVPASVHFRRWREKLNILHLNTTLVYKPGIKDNQMIDFNQANDPKMWMRYYRDDIPTIVLGHNSFYDLKKDERTTLQGCFGKKKVSAYLCGDTHIKEDDPDKILITVNVKGYTDTIPNIVCAKGVADLIDDYSDFGFYWHEWDEISDRVTVVFRRWLDVYLTTTAPDGPERYYSMKRNNENTSILISNNDRWKYRILIMGDNLEHLNYLYQELIKSFENDSLYHVSIYKAATPYEVLHMNMDIDFDIFILYDARNPESPSQMIQYQDFGKDMLKRMLENRPDVKKAKFFVYSKVKKQIIGNEFEEMGDYLDIEYIQKMGSIAGVTNAVKNYLDYLYEMGY